MNKLTRSPNLMITSRCNQQCEYCFAKKEMSFSKNPEMSTKRYKTILKKIQNEEVTTIKLLGGEPMIHSQIQQFIKIGLKDFKYINIFSNDLFSKANEDFLTKHYPKVIFTFNLTTPAFTKNIQVRSFLINRIKKIAKKTSVTVTLTVYDQLNLIDFINTITPSLIREISYIRIGIASPILGSKNTYIVKKLPLFGSKIVTFIKKAVKINPKLGFVFDCGVTLCMFNKNQLSYLKKQKIEELNRWGCYVLGMDISTKSEAFPCFALSSLYKIPIAGKKLSKIQGFLIFSRYLYWKKYSLPKCKKCPHWGFELNKCAGPCLAYRLNEFKKLKQDIINISGKIGNLIKYLRKS